MNALWQDLRYGLRMLAKSPGFTAVAVLTLALGIGANTAIFSLLDQVLLRLLPVKHPETLVVLRSPGPVRGHVWSDGDDAESFSFPMYKALREKNSVFSGLLARFPFSASVASRGGTELTEGALVSGNYFEVLGVRPALGRVFTLDDDRVPGAHPVVVLSYGYWMRHFGGDPGMLNQTIRVNDTQMTVVGVAQRGFTGIQVGQSPALFVPLMMKAQITPNWNGLDNWNDYWLAVLGRLKPGISRAQAEVGVNVTYGPLLEEQAPLIHHWSEGEREQFVGRKILLASGAHGRPTLQRDAQGPLLALFGMVGLVLLIACANVASLLLARGAARQRELAIRRALGASRWRLMRQLMAENVLCAVGGGVLGMVFASWTTDALISEVQAGASVQGLTSQLNGGVLSFAAAATILSAFLFGLLPAWLAVRDNLAQIFKAQGSTGSSGGSRIRFRKILVAGQVAFTMLLLAGAGLFIRTLWNLRTVDLGMHTDHLLTFSIAPGLSGYSPAKTAAFCDQLRQRLLALPGVRGSGSAEIPTLVGSAARSNITVPGGNPLPEEETHIRHNWISPGYFSTLGVPLLAGREFTTADTAAAPKVAIVDAAMVRRFFGNRNPIGERFAFGGGNVKPDIEIVGVVKDVKQVHVREGVEPYIYLPYTQMESLSRMSYYVRTTQDPAALAGTIRQTVHQLDAALPVYAVNTLDGVIQDDLFAERMVSVLSGSFGALAALLAALGIYGLLAYFVVQRTREIGIRMALGARPTDVLKMVLRQGAILIGWGFIAGLVAALAVTPLLRSLLFDLQPNDPLTLVAVTAALVLVALAACYIPARRATRVDPMVALRYE